MAWWAICQGWSKLVHLLTPCLRIRTQNSRSCKWHSPFVNGCKLWFRRVVPLAWSNDLVCSRRWTASFVILDMLITIPRIAKHLNDIRSSQPLIALQSGFLRSFLNSCRQLQIWSRDWDKPKCLRATCSCKLVKGIPFVWIYVKIFNNKWNLTFGVLCEVFGTERECFCYCRTPNFCSLCQRWAEESSLWRTIRWSQVNKALGLIGLNNLKSDMLRNLLQGR